MRFCPGCGAPRGSAPRPVWEDREAPAPQGAPPRDPVRVAAPPRPVPVPVQPASGKSYVTWAWACLVLYFLLYVPGLVANFIMWRSSVNYTKQTGERARGAGCLVWLLLIIGIGVPVVMVIGSVTGPSS